MVWPYQGGILKPFGWAYSKTLADWRFHQGIDIAGNEGDEVVAAMAGRVESVDDSFIYGVRVVLEHQSGLKTVYVGCKEVLVRAGDSVRASQPIGSIGSGAFECLDPDHLHFEVLTGQGHVDPVRFLP
jgi:murein DD-endopeptidase MepM/ murein hydrolase activator NlpD